MVAVILASGFSRRMGVNKLMMPIDDKPMIEHVILKSRGYFKTLLISSYDDVLNIGKKHGCHVIKNHYPERGLSESLKLAFEYEDECYLILLGDEPMISEAVLSKYRDINTSMIYQTKYIDGMGHPVLLPSWLKEDIANLYGDLGARFIIKNYKKQIIQLPVDHTKPKDVDTKEDLEMIKEMK